MKYNFSILLALIFTLHIAQSQEVEPLTEKSSQEMYDFHSLKHKKLKKLAGYYLVQDWLQLAEVWP